MGTEAAAVVAAPDAAAPAANAAAPAAAGAASSAAASPPALTVVPNAATAPVVEPAAQPAAVPAKDAATAAVEATAKATADAAAKVAEDSRRAALSSEARAAEDAKIAEDAAKKIALEKTEKLEARRKLAPEKYKDFVPPEGVELSAPVLTEFQTVARDLGLSQEDAQLIVDKLSPVVARNHATSVLSLARQASDAWVAAAATDPEYGGEKFAENSAVAKKTFDLFGTPALSKFLMDSGMGNHPELIRWAYRIGKMVGPDDKFIGGADAANKGPKAPEDSLWPDRT